MAGNKNELIDRILEHFPIGMASGENKVEKRIQPPITKKEKLKNQIFKLMKSQSLDPIRVKDKKTLEGFFFSSIPNILKMNNTTKDVKIIPSDNINEPIIVVERENEKVGICPFFFDKKGKSKIKKDMLYKISVFEAKYSEDLVCYIYDPEWIMDDDSTRVGIGKIGIAAIDIAINQDLTGITIDPKKALIDYIYWYLIKIQSQLMNYSQGTTVKGLERNTLKNLKIILPPLLVQQKIASILTNIDDLLNQTKMIINQLHLMKKGLMQCLFSEGIGHTEFKETKLGRIPKEWEIKILEQVISMINSGTWGDAPNENKKVFPILRSTEIKHDGRIDLSTVEYRGVNSNSLKKYILEDNDILIVSSSGSPRLVGRTSFFIKPNKENIYLFSNFMLRIRSKLINPKYLYYYLNSGRYKRFLNSLQQTATGLRNLPKGDLIKLKIPYPETKEQDKITEILTNIDKKIEQELEYIKKLKEIKKGLMQGLLTGKKRVNLE